MAAGKGGDAQEGRAADVPEKELRAEEGALPWQPGGEDQIYAVLEGREIRGPVSVRFAAEDAEAGPSRGAHRWLSKPGGMAAVRHQRASPPGIAQAEGCTVPAALAKQVLVRVYAAGLDLPDVAPSRADIPGCEFAGTVVEVGEGCERLRVGDEVWGFCPSNRGGGLAEFVAAEEVLVALKPLDLDWAFAAAVPRAGIAALFAVAPWPLATAPRATREGTGDGGRWVTPTDRLLVLGADSPVGIYVSQLACALGASVTAVCDHRNQDLLASLGANTRDEMRVEGARGWQGEGLTQPPTSRRNAGRDDKEEQMDLRSINPSGFFNLVLDCRPPAFGSQRVGGDWEQEQWRKGGGRGVTRGLRAARAEEGDQLRFKFWRFLSGAARKPLPGVVLVDADLADRMAMEALTPATDEKGLSRLDALVAERGRQREVPRVAMLLDQLRRAVEDGSLIPVLDPLSPFALEDSSSAWTLLANRANREPPAAWAIRDFQLLAESPDAPPRPETGEKDAPLGAESEAPAKRGVLTGLRRRSWGLVGGGGGEREVRAVAKIAVDAAAFRAPGGARGGYPQEVTLLRRREREKGGSKARGGGAFEKKKKKASPSWTGEGLQGEKHEFVVIGKARYDALVSSSVPGQVDLQLVLPPALARAVTRELSAGAKTANGAPLLWAVGNSGTGKLVVQVFPRTRVVRLSDVENILGEPRE